MEILPGATRAKAVLGASGRGLIAEFSAVKVAGAGADCAAIVETVSATARPGMTAARSTAAEESAAGMRAATAAAAMRMAAAVKSAAETTAAVRTVSAAAEVRVTATAGMGVAAAMRATVRTSAVMLSKSRFGSTGKSERGDRSDEVTGGCEFRHFIFLRNYGQRLEAILCKVHV